MGKGVGCWARCKSWRLSPTSIPKVYTILKWLCIILIAVLTALVGFVQSVVVSGLYDLRFNAGKQSIYKTMEGGGAVWWMRFISYAGVNVVLAFLCSFLLFIISPAASGSGIPDVKAFLNGVESPIWKNFFTVKTFVAKVICSALAVSSGLVMGKEGPMLHAGSIIAVILGSTKWLSQQMEMAAHWGTYTYNKELRDLVSVGVACGVTTAFKAPVGGVLFSMEISTRWRKELVFRCFLAAAITVVVVRTLVDECKQHFTVDVKLDELKKCSFMKWGSLVAFDLQFPTPYLQIWAVFLLAVVGGYLGCLYTSFNTWVCLVRKRWAKHMWARILEVCIISLVTSIVFFFIPWAGECKKCTSNTPNHCVSGATEFHTFTGYKCDDPGYYNDLAVLVFNSQGLVLQSLYKGAYGSFSARSLGLYCFCYWLLAGWTYGAFIPSGLFTPSLIFGGAFGRLFAKCLAWMHLIPDTDANIGLYTLLGAAAFLGGLMRMSAAMALILMEMTQQLSQLPFLMFTLVVSKYVGDQFNYSVFDHQMMLKGLAFVGIDEGKEKKHKLAARDIMSKKTRNTTLYVQETGPVLAGALDSYKELGAFPVTTVPGEDGQPGNFVGVISRANVQVLLDMYGKEAEKIDLSSKVEIAPIIIPPNMPLPFIYRVVNAEGFNYVPVIRQLGPLEGMVSRADLVDVQNKQLDDFHLKEQIEKMEQDIDAGNILQSMNLQGNVHAAKFKKFITNPLQATKEFLEEDENVPVQEQHEFFLMDSAGGPAAAAAAGGAKGSGAEEGGDPEAGLSVHAAGRPGADGLQWQSQGYYNGGGAAGGELGSGSVGVYVPPESPAFPSLLPLAPPAAPTEPYSSVEMGERQDEEPLINKGNRSDNV